LDSFQGLGVESVSLDDGVEEVEGGGAFGLGDLVGGAFEGDEVDFGVELLEACVLVFDEPGGAEC
jgi:hypothetical protein